MQRREFPRDSTFSARDASLPRERQSTGTFNSERPVPPPRSFSTPFTSTGGSMRGSANMDSFQTSITGPPGARGSKSARYDPFTLRVAEMVDEATEPGVTEQEADRLRKELVNVVTNRNLESMSLPLSTTAISGGQAVEYALRKRLKSENETAVLNTITLLDELMRTCPYFYRYIATEKFFRRLWRFVVPDYKNSMKSMIPIFGKQKLNPGVHSDSEVPQRILILIRAWAEELSIMFEGRYDQHAGFLIERYNNKREQVRFPPVPKTSSSLPWVCPVRRGGPDYLRGSASNRGSSADSGRETISLTEAENTVVLFSNLVDNANSISDLKEDLCKELFSRCRYIQQNLTRLSMSMSKEDELTRAIAISESLERTLAKYKKSLESGSISKGPHSADKLSIPSEDEGYDDIDRSEESLENSDRRGRYDHFEERGSRRVSSLRSDSSEFSSGVRDEWGRNREDSHDHGRRRQRYDDSSNRDRIPAQRDVDEGSSRRRKTATDESATRRDGVDSRYAPDDDERNRSLSPPAERRKASSKRRSPKAQSTATKKSALLRRQKSDSELQASTRKTSHSVRELKDKSRLVDVADDNATNSSEEEQENDESFSMLAQRYASHRITSKSKPSSSSKASRAHNSGKAGAERSNGGQHVVGAVQPSGFGSQADAGVHQVVAPGHMHAAAGAMPFNPMMFMPNPYALYGSVSHIPTPDAMNMYGAYQTINPSMYYSTVGPGMIPTFPQAGGFQPGPSVATGGQLRTLQPPGTEMQALQPALNQAPGNDGTSRTVPPDNAAHGDPQNPDDSHQRHPKGSQALPQGQEQAQMTTGMNFGTPMLPMGAYYASSPSVRTGPTPAETHVSNDAQMAQAAMYHSAMQQAAAAYHVAATAYQSVSGQAPVSSGRAAHSMAPSSSGTSQKVEEGRPDQTTEGG